MIFFAIQQVSSNLFLPSGGKGFGGHTRQVPTNERPPRLFMSEVTAKRALHCYSEGIWSDHYSQSYDGEYDYSGPEPDYRTKRNKEDFKIVKLEIKICHQQKIQ